MAQLCQHQDELERRRVEVLIITFGSLPSAQKWLAETCSPFKLLLDPDRTAYDAYKSERSQWPSWNLRTIWR